MGPRINPFNLTPSPPPCSSFQTLTCARGNHNIIIISRPLMAIVHLDMRDIMELAFCYWKPWLDVSFWNQPLLPWDVTILPHSFFTVAHLPPTTFIKILVLMFEPFREEWNMLTVKHFSLDICRASDKSVFMNKVSFRTLSLTSSVHCVGTWLITIEYKSC